MTIAMTADEIMALAAEWRGLWGCGEQEDEGRAALRAAFEQVVRERDYYRETCNHWAGGQWQERAERAERENAELRALLKEARNKALEEAANEAEHWQTISTTPGHACGQYIAAAIRGLARIDAAREGK